MARIFRKRLLAALGFAGCLLAMGPKVQAAGQSFGDWFAECRDASSCRADAFVKGERNPIGFDFRLSVEKAADGIPRLIFQPLFQPLAASSTLTLRVDREAAFALNPGGGYRALSGGRYRVEGEERTRGLLHRMRDGTRLLLSYRDETGEAVQVQVSLKGATAALNRIGLSAAALETPAAPAESATGGPEAPAREQPEETAQGQAEPLVEPDYQPSEPEGSGRISGEWPDDLFLYEAAVTRCLEESEAKPARVGSAWDWDDELVAVHLIPWSGAEELCLAAREGGEVTEIRPIRPSDGAPEPGPIFSPVEFGKPEGDCFKHEPVFMEDGTPIGWLSFSEC